jgi:hypothetical protein
MNKEQFIRIEVSDKKHIIASRMIGSEDSFTQIATATNRGNAERLVNKLNSTK